MNRRGFLRALSVTAITVIAPLKFIAPILHQRVLSSLSLTDIVNTTLRNRSHLIAANITKTNPLFNRIR